MLLAPSPSPLLVRPTIGGGKERERGKSKRGNGGRNTRRRTFDVNRLAAALSHCSRECNALRDVVKSPAGSATAGRTKPTRHLSAEIFIENKKRARGTDKRMPRKVRPNTPPGRGRKREAGSLPVGGQVIFSHRTASVCPQGTSLPRKEMGWVLAGNRGVRTCEPVKEDMKSPCHGIYLYCFASVTCELI